MRLSAAQVKPAILYEVDASNAMDAEHTLKDIDCFMRDAKQRAYIPGSSVKGAIRTALLFDAIQKERTRHDLIDDKRGIPEADYFHTLNLNPKKRDDAVNSIMRGIQISDSLPIDDRNMMLTLKTDSAVNGQTHAINLCRECVAPGTRIRFALTLDQSILKGKWTADSILEALRLLRIIRIKRMRPDLPSRAKASADGKKSADAGRRRRLFQQEPGVSLFGGRKRAPMDEPAVEPGFQKPPSRTGCRIGDFSAHAEIRPISAKTACVWGL